MAYSLTITLCPDDRDQFALGLAVIRETPETFMSITVCKTSERKNWGYSVDNINGPFVPLVFCDLHDYKPIGPYGLGQYE
jgi:hypothetical protein